MPTPLYYDVNRTPFIIHDGYPLTIRYKPFNPPAILQELCALSNGNLSPSSWHHFLGRTFGEDRV